MIMWVRNSDRDDLSLLYKALAFSWRDSVAGRDTTAGAGLIQNHLHSHAWQLMLVVCGNPAGAVSQNTYAWFSMWPGFLITRWLQGGSFLHSDSSLQS